MFFLAEFHLSVFEESVYGRGRGALQSNFPAGRRGSAEAGGGGSKNHGRRKTGSVYTKKTWGGWGLIFFHIGQRGGWFFCWASLMMRWQPPPTNPKKAKKGTPKKKGCMGVVRSPGKNSPCINNIRGFHFRNQKDSQKVGFSLISLSFHSVSPFYAYPFCILEEDKGKWKHYLVAKPLFSSPLFCECNVCAE